MYTYTVSYRNGHASVRIDLDEYKRFKAYLLDLACYRSAEALEPIAGLQRKRGGRTSRPTA
jgi:hypothetical protein